MNAIDLIGPDEREKLALLKAREFDLDTDVPVEAAHSPLGPSSSERWLRCPASVAATAGRPNEDTEWSAEGTFAHSITEEARARRVRVEELIGQKGAVGGFNFEVTAEMAEHLQGFIDYVQGIPGDDYNETRVRYVEYVKNGFGTMDAAKAYAGRVHIIDLKYGEGWQVWAKNNSQLKLYALGFYLMYGWMYEISEFVLTIYQPRLQHIDSDVISLPDLLKWAEDVVRPGALLTESPDAPFAAGDWCKFCLIRRNCKTRGQAVTKAMTGELTNLDAASVTKIRPVNTLTNEQIDAALRVKKMVTSWFSDLEAHARSQVKQGHDVAGWKFVDGRSDRKWKFDALTTATRIRECMDPQDPTDIHEPIELLSPAKMEKALGKELFAPPKEKKQGKLTIKLAPGPLYDLVEKPRGKPVLVPPEDPREAITATALNELTVIPDPEIEL